jgi:hypothetical protein
VVESAERLPPILERQPHIEKVKAVEIQTTMYHPEGQVWEDAGLLVDEVASSIPLCGCQGISSFPCCFSKPICPKVGKFFVHGIGAEEYPG